SELRSVLFHELDRLMPVSIEEFVFDYEMTERPVGAGRLTVTVALVRKHLLSEVLDKATARKIWPVAVIASDVSGRPLRINLSPSRPKLRLPIVIRPQG